MTALLTICETCAASREEKHINGRTGGEILAGLIEALPREGGAPALRRHACLMGCDHPCNVALSAPGRMSYVLGDFRPDADSAEAILSFARLYADSPTGIVPYRSWPQGVKGHFIARIPPHPPEGAGES